MIHLKLLSVLRLSPPTPTCNLGFVGLKNAITILHGFHSCLDTSFNTSSSSCLQKTQLVLDSCQRRGDEHGFRSLCVISVAFNFFLSRQHYETEEFVNRVDEALVILKEQKVLVREFKSRMKIRDTIDASCIDNWMQLLMKNHIKIKS